MEARGQCWVSSSITVHRIFLRQGLSEPGAYHIRLVIFSSLPPNACAVDTYCCFWHFWKWGNIEGVQNKVKILFLFTHKKRILLHVCYAATGCMRRSENNFIEFALSLYLYMFSVNWMTGLDWQRYACLCRPSAGIKSVGHHCPARCYVYCIEYLMCRELGREDCKMNAGLDEIYQSLVFPWGKRVVLFLADRTLLHLE